MEGLLRWQRDDLGPWEEGISSQISLCLSYGLLGHGHLLKKNFPHTSFQPTEFGAGREMRRQRQE